MVGIGGSKRESLLNVHQTSKMSFGVLLEYCGTATNMQIVAIEQSGLVWDINNHSRGKNFWDSKQLG